MPDVTSPQPDARSPAPTPGLTVDVPESVPGAGIGFRRRLRYWRRVFSAYVGGGTSHLTFWHGVPEVNERTEPGQLGEYWQRFAVKADYPGPKDEAGIPMLDYHGHVGLQYNPIAIAQYGLGNYNQWCWTGSEDRRRTFLGVAEWLAANLEPNPAGLAVWNHHFDWEYRTPLRSPWYSCLSQGQGLSLLVRAHRETGDSRFLDAAYAAFESFNHPMKSGGVSYWDEDGYLWLEETVVKPPTHILNGFMWAAWGVYDLALHTGDARARSLWESSVETLSQNLDRFDLGFWSAYDEPGTRLSNPTSAFYHALHIVQLRIMHLLTDRDVFAERAARWQAYRERAWYRRRAWLHKSVFKLLYY
jgi:heparosan-N-sulfate-glucuronate 5-epimerase